MAYNTHECPAPGCALRVPFSRLACLTHWRLIPSHLQQRLLLEYGHSFGEESYFQARADCLRALHVPEDEIADLNGGIS